MGYGSVKTKIGDLEDMSILSTEICVPYEFVYERKPGEEDRKFIDEHRSKILEALSYAIANIEGIYRIEWDARNQSRILKIIRQNQNLLFEMQMH